MSRHTGRRLARLAFAGALAAVVAWAMTRRPFPVRVTGRSMSPTLEPGDLVAVTPLRAAPGPGDVVVVRRSEGPELVKRVAAVGGGRYAGAPVPPGSVAVTGDNSAASTDSREFGPVPEAALAGRARLVYWPPRRWRLL